MLTLPSDFPPPQTAWEPIEPSTWTQAQAVHLLGRIGFSATPEEAAAAVRRGLPRTVAKAFNARQSLTTPTRLRTLQDGARAYQEEFNRLSQLINATPAGAERDALTRQRTTLQNDRNRERQLGYRDYSFEWLHHARQPQNSATEKLVMFFQNVWVVSYPAIQDPYALYLHQHLIRENLLGPYPAMCKALSRSPAMIDYLNLQTSRRTAPNQNFARELMELFTLGEGNYTQQDVAEASRAFTGYRHRYNEYYFDSAQFDSTNKTILGRTANFTGDMVIDHIFTQPAAARFLVQELLAYYLSDEPLPAEYVQTLATEWAAAGFRIDRLLERVFSSRAFHHPIFQGKLIKDPTHYYLGLLQSLQLDVLPLAQFTATYLANMGMAFFAPPNVRGWVGHRTWVNATTLNARRQLVDFLFGALNENSLNADDRATVQLWRSQGRGTFQVPAARLTAFGQLEPATAAEAAIGQYLAGQAPDAFRQQLESFLRTDTSSASQRSRNALVAVLESPNCNLC